VADVQRAMESIPRPQRGMVLADTPEAKETARRILLQSSENVRLTLGGMTGNPAQRGLEDTLRNSTSSPTVADMWTRFKGAQDQDLQAAWEGRLLNPPGQAPLNEAEAGQKLSEMALARQQQMRADTSGAYKQLGATTAGGMDALPLHQQLVFGPSASADLVGRLSDTARKFPFLGDNTRAALDEATRLATGRTVDPTGKLLPDAIKDISPDASHFNLGAYNETRMRLNRIYGRADNEQDRTVIRQVISDLDDSVQAAHAAGQVAGDPALLGKMQDAVAKSREEFKTFKPQSDEARAFVDTVTKPGVTGQAVIDDLYGAGRVGNKSDTTQILDHFDKLYPVGTEARDVAKQAAARRIIFGATEDKSAMSPGNISKRISEAVNPTGNGREISEKLFTPDELDSMLRLRDMMGPLQEQGRMNPSGTAYRLADMMKGWANSSKIFSRVFGEERGAINASRRALSGGLPLYTPRAVDAPLGAFRTSGAAVGGGVAGQQDVPAPVARAGATGLLSVPPFTGLAGR
jgi:hypothetical protein